VFVGIAQQDLRDEKVLVGRKVERRRKSDIKPDFLAGDRPVPTGRLIRARVDPRIDVFGTPSTKCGSLKIPLLLAGSFVFNPPTTL